MKGRVSQHIATLQQQHTSWSPCHLASQSSAGWNNLSTTPPHHTFPMVVLCCFVTLCSTTKQLVISHCMREQMQQFKLTCSCKCSPPLHYQRTAASSSNLTQSDPQQQCQGHVNHLQEPWPPPGLEIGSPYFDRLGQQFSNRSNLSFHLGGNKINPSSITSPRDTL
jgi:hypothetical protein